MAKIKWLGAYTPVEQCSQDCYLKYGEYTAKPDALSLAACFAQCDVAHGELPKVPSGGMTIPAGTTLPGGLTLPKGWTLPAGFQLPAGWTIPPEWAPYIPGVPAGGYQLPMPWTFPLSFTLPADFTLPASLPIPIPIVLPAGAPLPQNLPAPAPAPTPTQPAPTQPAAPSTSSASAPSNMLPLVLLGLGGLGLVAWVAMSSKSGGLVGAGDVQANPGLWIGKYGQKTEDLYKQMLAESRKYKMPQSFRTDLTKHDRKFLLHTWDRNEPFGWVLYSSGTHLQRPSKKGQVKQVAEHFRINYPGSHHFYFYDGVSLREVSEETWVSSMLNAVK